MNFALDTNRYTDFMRGKAEAVSAVRAASQIGIPLTVVGELRAGFLAGTRGRENEKSLVRFLNSDRVRVLYPAEATTHLYARVFLDLRKKGTPIPTNDIWVAALAMEHDLPLFTRDRHFDQVDGLATM